MNMDAIGSAILMVYDELKNDKASKQIIKKLDNADSDDVIKDNMKKAIRRLRELDKPNVASAIEEKLKGFI